MMMTMNIIHLKFIIAALALSLLLQRTVTAFIRTTNFFFAYDISFLLLCRILYTDIHTVLFSTGEI